MPTWGGRDRRAQGDVIALVLLLVVTIAGATAVVSLGGDAITGIQDSATAGAAEQSMTQFDSKASLVAHGDSDAQRVRLVGSAGATREVDADAGWMNVTVRNTTDGEVRAVLTNTTLGAVVYSEGDTSVAYQGGGVWRRTGNGSSMISPPEFHYRGTTLTLPLVTVSGDERLDGEVVVRRAGTAEAVYPNESASLANPLDDGRVVITVGSEYYAAWGRFFEQRTSGDVTIDHANETATIELVTPADIEPVNAALTSRAVGDEIDLDGTGNDNVWVDSYNSSEGPYADSQTANGTIVTAGSIDVEGNGKILGNVRAGGSITLGTANGNITGTVEHTTGYSANPNAVPQPDSPRVSQIDGVEAGEDLSPYVESRLVALEADNDNGATDAIVDDGGDPVLNFSGTGDTVELSSADGTEYYLSGIDMGDDEELVVDTGSGSEVQIAVGDDVSLDGTKIRVEGDGVVRFFVADDVTLDGANVSVPGDRSGQLWMYGTEASDVTISGGSRFVGVLYVTGDGDDNEFSIKQSDVYGGVVAGEMDVQNGGTVHYDMSLSTEQTIPVDADVPRITYLHVSITEIEVSDD
ncbi:DUF7289 family protein [Halobaculum sp. EA56]|uniref:DUF7289 family protein n=1 Tax=Halobaculum sp. EA56 TaxID=3421648 RepID=UPI003EBEAAC5